MSDREWQAIKPRRANEAARRVGPIAEAHDTDVQLIDISIVRVRQQGADGHFTIALA